MSIHLQVGLGQTPKPCFKESFFRTPLKTPGTKLQTPMQTPGGRLLTPLRTPKSVRRGPEVQEDDGRILGTPDYLAPEILLQRPHGEYYHHERLSFHYNFFFFRELTRITLKKFSTY